MTSRQSGAWPNGLGRVLGGLEEAVKRLTKNVDDEKEIAQRHRDNLVNVIAAMTESVRALTVSVGTMLPDVADYREKRAELRGVGKAGKIVWAVWIALGGIFGAVATWVMQHVTFH